MEFKALEMTEAARGECADRIGMAKLAKLAFDGHDLGPKWAELIAKLLNGTADAGEGIDLRTGANGLDLLVLTFRQQPSE